MHGYQIHREATLDQTELWTGIKPGSIYNALHRMADEGLVQVERTERDGGSPERTVYRITADGKRELSVQRDAALHDVLITADPLDLALRYVSDVPSQDLSAVIQARRQVLAQRLAVHEAAFDASSRYLVGLESITFQHVLQRLRAELIWHEHLLQHLPEHFAATGR